jgi:hypothetical protein
LPHTATNPPKADSIPINTYSQAIFFKFFLIFFYLPPNLSPINPKCSKKHEKCGFPVFLNGGKTEYVDDWHLFKVKGGRGTGN